MLPADFYRYLNTTEFTGTQWGGDGLYYAYTDQGERSLFGEISDINFKIFEDPDPLTYNESNAGYFTRKSTSNAAVSDGQILQSAAILEALQCLLLVTSWRFSVYGPIIM